MTFEQQWIEYDYNPFILFDSNGKIVSLNTEAQFLLQYTTPIQLYELATSYANITFGFKITFLDLEFGRYSFFAIMVGYEDEQKIGIRLYQKPSKKISSTKLEGKLTNIYTIIDLCIATNSINSDIEFTKDFDPTIPEIILEQNKFIRILNDIYECFLQNKKINTKIFYRVGEYIKIQNKKYPIIALEVSAKKQNKEKLLQIRQKIKDTNIYIESTDQEIILNIPMILQL